MFSQGCIVASDLTQEWLLPWWWDHYSHNNDLPVMFIDLGMSQEKKAWCQERGYYERLYLPEFVADKEHITPSHLTEWGGVTTKKHFWDSRRAWFQKPMACLKSPFALSLWLDLDCEIRGSLAPLFSLPSFEIIIGREHLDGKQESVNSGVLLFEQNSTLLHIWAHEALHYSHLYAGDQDILTYMFQKDPSRFGTLPPIYNWSRIHKDNPRAIVLHWHGQHGKSAIIHQMMRNALLQEGLL